MKRKKEIKQYTSEVIDSVVSSLDEKDEVKIKNKTDLINYFSDINDVINPMDVYIDVMGSADEVFSLVEEYKQSENSFPFIIDHDIFLIERNNETATQFNMRVEYLDETGELTEISGDFEMILNCKIKVFKNFFLIKPSIYLINYENDGETEVKNLSKEEEADFLFEAEDPKEQTDDQFDSPEGQEDEEDNLGDSEESEMDMEDDVLTDEEIKDVIFNIISSKIYNNGFDMPDEDTLNEITDKVVGMIESEIENLLNFDSEEENNSTSNKTVNAPKKNSKNQITVYEKKEYYVLLEEENEFLPSIMTVSAPNFQEAKSLAERVTNKRIIGIVSEEGDFEGFENGE